MTTRPSVTSIAVLAAILLLSASSVHGKRKDLVIELMPPEAQYFGSYAGATRIALGEVRDEGFIEAPDFVGVGPEAVYAVVLAGGREGAIRSAVSKLLEVTGLAAAPGDADYLLDVVIRRNRFFINQTAIKFRLRSEVFLEFTLRQGDTVVGRVLACGNSQRKTQLASKAKVEATYQVGLNDALSKLVKSDTFRRLVGEGWTPATARWGNPEITPIDRDKFYGPSDTAQAEVYPARLALVDVDPKTLVLQDFALMDQKYLEDKGADPELAASYLPELVRVHLGAFFPGAFATVERRGEPQPGDGVVLAGNLLRFKIGSFAKRVWIGFGAGKDKLEAEVLFQDGAGQELFKLDIVSSNWGAGFQIKKGQLRDIADQAARDIAYLLVQALVPDYTYPPDLEVAFDGLPYPSAGSRREGDVRRESP